MVLIELCGALSASNTRGGLSAVELIGPVTILDSETNAQQAEATLEQVQTDLSNMATFAEEVHAAGTRVVSCEMWVVLWVGGPLPRT